MNERIRPVYKKKKKKKTIEVARETVDSISVAPIAKRFFGKEVSRKLHCWTKQMENLDAPIFPQIKDGKMARLSFRAASSLIWWGMGVCCSILFLLTDCIYHHVKGNSILSKSRKDSALFIQPRLSINLTARQGIREN